jgi:hypothetical protein
MYDVILLYAFVAVVLVADTTNADVAVSVVVLVAIILAVPAVVLSTDALMVPEALVVAIFVMVTVIVVVTVFVAVPFLLVPAAALLVVLALVVTVFGMVVIGVVVALVVVGDIAVFVDVVLVTKFMRTKVALPGPDTVIDMGVVVFG